MKIGSHGNNFIASSNSIAFNSLETKSQYFDTITKAISERKHLNIAYSSLIKDTKTNRVVEPQRIYFLNGNLYLSAFDLEAKSDRVFKVDLIEECNTIDPKDHVSVTEPPKLFDITLNVRKSHRSFIERNSSVISASKDLGESFEVHIQISNLEWLRRSILSNAPGIAISSPSSLADEVLESANSVLALYQA